MERKSSQEAGRSRRAVSFRVLRTMRERAAKLNTDRVRQEDIANAGGAPEED